MLRSKKSVLFFLRISKLCLLNTSLGNYYDTVMTIVVMFFPKLSAMVLVMMHVVGQLLKLSYLLTTAGTNGQTRLLFISELLV